MAGKTEISLGYALVFDNETISEAIVQHNVSNKNDEYFYPSVGAAEKDAKATYATDAGVKAYHVVQIFAEIVKGGEVRVAKA